MPTHFLTSISSILLIVPCLTAGEPASGPWKLDQLDQPPRVTWVEKSGSLRKLYYESEPRGGRPTRVFAYCAFPAETQKPGPALVLVHGGGGTAFPEWAQLWAKRGYVALAMDLAGHGPDGKRLPEGGPDQGDAAKFPPPKTPLTDIWSYHAVAAVIRGVSVLRALPQVDPERIGITGISWGGYLTCLVAGLDHRLKVAVPVYGCGFLHENSVWLPIFQKMPSEWRATWVAHFDPSRYLGQARMPVLFVNGTNDFAYPLDSYQKSYRLVKNRQLCITVNLPHGHPQGWAPVEIGFFVDQHLRGGIPLPAFQGFLPTKVQGQGHIVKVGYTSTLPLKKAEWHWTIDQGPWQKRRWHSRAATIGDGFIQTQIPKEVPLVYFLTITDNRGATVSTEHFIQEKN